MEDRIIELEKKISFQEHSIDELNEALILQQKQIDVLQLTVKRLHDHLESGELIKKPEEETPPPHY